MGASQLPPIPNNPKSANWRNTLRTFFRTVAALYDADGYIANDKVQTASVADLAITTAKIAADAVTTAKIEKLNASRAVVTNGSGALEAATTTATEIGYVNGVTSAIQTQLDGKAASTHKLLSATHDDTEGGTVTRGDLVTGQASPAKWKRLAIGTSGKVLSSDGTDVAWSLPKHQPLFASTAAATVTGTTSETTLIGSGSGSLTLAANALAVGTALRIRAFGYCTTPGSSVASVQIKIKFGSTVIVAGPNAAPGTGKTGVGFNVDAIIICRTTGATGTVQGEGEIRIHTNATTYGATCGVGGMISSSPITIDTTATQTVDMTATLSSGAGTDSYTIENFTLELMNI